MFSVMLETCKIFYDNILNYDCFICNKKVAGFAIFLKFYFPFNLLSDVIFVYRPTTL